MKIQVPLSRVWIALPIAASLLVAFVQRIRPHDYWWHLAMGRWFSETGKLPTSNLFLYTRPLDEPFFNQPWLGQWLMFKMHDFNGPIVGVVFLALSCLFFTLLSLAFLKAENVRPQIASVVAVLSLAAAKPIFSVRTRMFAIIPMALVCTILFRFRKGSGSEKSLYFIPLIIVFWANTHGSFVVGVMLTWFLWADFVWQRLFGALPIPNRKLITASLLAVSATVAGCIHPFGIRVYQYVFQLAIQSDVGSTVSEWQPLSIQQPIGVFVFILVLISLFFLVRARKELSLFAALCFALGVYLGVSAERSLLFFACIVPFVIAPFLPKAKEEVDTPERFESIINGGIIAAFIGLVLISFPPFRPAEISAVMPPTRESDPGKGLLSDENISPDSVRFAKRVFHEQGIGGQLEWIFNGPSAFVDQRMEYIPQSVWDEYEIVSGGRQGWDLILQKYNVDTVIVHRETQGNLLRVLRAGSRFNESGVDGPYTIFSLDGFENPLKKHDGNRNKDDIDRE